MKSDADRNRGGGEKKEKSRQKTSSRRKSKIKKSNRRGRRQKTSESNPLRSPPPDQVRLGTPVPYSQSRESKMTKTQKSVKCRMAKILPHPYPYPEGRRGRRGPAMVEVDRDGTTDEVPRGASSYRSEGVNVLPKEKRHRYRVPNQKIKVVSGRSSRIEPRAPYYSTPMRVVYAPSKQREQTAIAGRERTPQDMKRSHA